MAFQLGLHIPLEVARMICTYLRCDSNYSTSSDRRQTLKRIRLVNSTFAAAGAESLFHAIKCVLPAHILPQTNVQQLTRSGLRPHIKEVELVLNLHACEREGHNTSPTGFPIFERDARRTQAYLCRFTAVRRVGITINGSSEWDMSFRPFMKTFLALISTLAAMWKRFNEVDVITEDVSFTDLAVLQAAFQNKTRTQRWCWLDADVDGRAETNVVSDVLPLVEQLQIEGPSKALEAEDISAQFPFDQPSLSLYLLADSVGSVYSPHLKTLSLSNLNLADCGLSKWLHRCASTIQRVGLHHILLDEEEDEWKDVLESLSQAEKLTHLSLYGTRMGYDSRVYGEFNFSHLEDVKIECCRMHPSVTATMILSNQEALRQVHFGFVQLYIDPVSDYNWGDIFQLLGQHNSIQVLRLEGLIDGDGCPEDRKDAAEIMRGYRAECDNMQRRGGRMRTGYSPKPPNPRAEPSLFSLAVDCADEWTLSCLGDLVRGMRIRTGSWLGCNGQLMVPFAKELASLYPPWEFMNSDVELEDIYEWDERTGKQILCAELWDEKPDDVDRDEEFEEQDLLDFDNHDPRYRQTELTEYFGRMKKNETCRQTWKEQAVC